MNNTPQTPMVSVWMITYNHEPFIAQAIESVLMQKTTFPIELVIGEDCSTDGTAAIVKEYADKYPHIIRARFNQPNLGMMPNVIKTLEECQGKYIALLEGDDYWTDDHKLQKQVDFMEENGEYSLTCTFKAIEQNGIISKIGGGSEVATKTRLNVLTDFIAPTQTICFRNYPDLVSFFNRYPSIYGGDRAITYFASIKGKLAVLPFHSAVYRITYMGVSSSIIGKAKLRIRFQSFIDLHYSLGLPMNVALTNNLFNSVKRLTVKEKTLFFSLILNGNIKLRYPLMFFLYTQMKLNLYRLLNIQYKLYAEISNY